MKIIFIIYVIGMIAAFIIGCMLAWYYEYIHKEKQQWSYIATFSLLSWVAVVMILINYKKPFIHIYRMARRKINRIIHNMLRSNK